MISMDIVAQMGAFELKVKLLDQSGITLIVGPNGAGKTTLLRCLLGVKSPTRGTVRLGEQVLFSSADRIDVPIEERRLGYLPQHYALFPHLSVTENVGFGIHKRANREECIHTLLHKLNIEHLADRRPTMLSGGEGQRVALARALAIEPRAMLLDEPMAALDAGARSSVRTFLDSQLGELNIPTIIVSHDMDDADVLADQIVVLEDGAISQLGTLADLRRNPRTDFVKHFVGQST